MNEVLMTKAIHVLFGFGTDFEGVHTSLLHHMGNFFVHSLRKGPKGQLLALLISSRTKMPATQGGYTR